MKKIVLTCVACGAVEEVEDKPEQVRDRKCKKCGASMIEKRPPGDTTAKVS